MSDPGTARAGRCCAVAAALATAGAAVITVALAAPGRWPLVAVLLGALLWGLGGTIAVALTPTGQRRPGHDQRWDDQRWDDQRWEDQRWDDQRWEDQRWEDQRWEDAAATATIGTVMHLGGVPDEVARTTAALATASGPVALVVPSGRAVPELLDPAVVVVQPDGDGPADAVSALQGSCDAVLFVSARALPAAGCREAASRLTSGASWVVGTAEPLNRDHFGPTRRELLDARLRRRAAAAGLWCWEPDATVVRTSLLRAHPFRPGRPLGSWLRERAAEGLVGATVDTPLARRAAPVAAEGYWPDTTARQRGAAADLSEAATSTSCRPRARAVAAGLLVHALSGWSVVLWLAALVLLAGGSPIRRGEGALAALVGGALVLRWLALHLAGGTRPAPVADVVAGLYALPGSLLATASALSRRVRPASRPVPTRPLVWLALVATAAAANVVLTARPGDGVARLAAGAAAVLLVLLWVFTVRSLVERSWRRVGFRIPLDLPAVVETANEPADDDPAVDRDGRCPQPEPGWRLVDGSPGGFSVLGPVTGYSRGDEVTVRVPRPTGTELVLDGTVAGRRLARRGHRGAEVLGVELRAATPGTGAWAATLLDGASGPPPTTLPLVDEHPDESGWSRRVDQLAVGLVIGVSLTVALTLALVLAGLRPLTIRSGSMEPAYSVGDVVLVATEQAGDLRPGQVVTRFDAPEAIDSLTHRVQEVSRDGDDVQVTTRGDANESAEVWSVPADREVGGVVASVPAVGVPLTLVRSSTSWAVVAGIAVFGVVAVLLRPRRRKTADGAEDDESFNPLADVPTGSGTAGPRTLRAGPSDTTGEQP